MHVVWLKRDLRLADHAPLHAALDAADDGNGLLLLYVAEPERQAQPDVSDLHLAWDLANARALLQAVDQRGGTMRIEVGDAVDVLDRLNNVEPIHTIQSHEETGLMWSWNRDRRVLQWCTEHGIPWTEHAANGVVRRLKNRDRWNGMRNRRMAADALPAPVALPPPQKLESVDASPEWVPPYNTIVTTPLKPGEMEAHRWLDTFLDQRYTRYLPTISNPATSPEGSSRLSAYIATGVLSVRQVVKAITATRLRANQLPAEDRSVLAKNVNAFASRVSWRCHFVQRLEVETTMDTTAINPELCTQLGRQDDDTRFQAWATGQTGWPFFDACMRSLIATGWINFRMRAMLQSVAAYTLNLPWQRTGQHLAKLFIDYEPGIHWSQIHMQSGVTGINSVRAYSVTKQSLNHDMQGEFIRTWVPELAMVPTPYIHEPWTMSTEMQAAIGVSIGTTYPTPIVDESEARTKGIAAAYAAKRNEQVNARSAAVYTKHGSRKQRGRRPTSRRTTTAKPSTTAQPVRPSLQRSLLDFEGTHPR